MKRMVSVCLAVLFLFTALPLGAVSAANIYVGGDVNADGKVNVKDLGLLQQYLNGWDVVLHGGRDEYPSGDVNGDGKVNVRDLGLFQQWLNGWDVTMINGSETETMIGGLFTDVDSDTTISATANTKTVCNGGEFTVDIAIGGNPGLAGWNVGMIFDESAFEVVEIIKNGVFPASGMSYGPLKSPTTATFADFTYSDVTRDGVMYRVKLKVKANALAGPYDLLLGTANNDPDNFSNQDFDTVAVALVGTTITVGHRYDGVCDATCNDCGATRTTVDHTYDNACDATCNGCGIVRTVLHFYDNACDSECNACGLWRAINDHVYTSACDDTCNECGAYRTPLHSYTNDCDRDCNGCGATRVPPHSYRYDCQTMCNRCGAQLTPAAEHIYSYACDNYCDLCSEYRADTNHTYSDPCDMDCNECGATRWVTHVYDNACDAECNLCGSLRVVEGHAYSGDSDPTCNNCGEVRIPPVMPEDAPQFAVDDARACYGNTFTVAVRTRNNPGIAAYRLYVHYDTALLELVSAEQGAFDGITFGPITSVPFNALWCDMLNPDNTADDVVVYLTFRAKEGVDPTETTISLTYDPEDVYNTAWDSVYFYPVSGTVKLTATQPGDVNGDGKVNVRDLGLFQQYLNDWPVDIILDVCDVNGDDKVNVRDLGLFQQFLNGWNVEIV